MKYSREELQPMLEYIKKAWTGALFRSHRGIADAAVDPKLPPALSGKWPVYISSDEQADEVAKILKRQISEDNMARIEIRQLPADSTVIEQGLLYLPHSYVVPGGRFNEMYGWDSYFILLGLLEDGETEIAQHIIDNFIYEVRYYGKVLNANRTYYLSRSNPPFLSRMILELYAKKPNAEWLSSTISALEDTYNFWIQEPHLTLETNLSRYYDFGEGPAPEVLSSERDEKGRTHYDRILDYFLRHDHQAYNIDKYYDKDKRQLTDLFYKGDRTMRESGFDPADRFGPFNVDCMSYNPVCLNSLLYQFETDMIEILSILKLEGDDVWKDRALKRREAINKLMWDEQDGMYYDYNFEQKTIRRYPYLTTFYPLWTGVATPEHAAKLVQSLKLFERDGGLLTSTHDSGMQWDMPFGWAPLNLIAIEGLRRYGYHEEAQRISDKFISMVFESFKATGSLLEKYDVIKSTSKLEGIEFGYSSNEIGFGWTNGTILRLLSNGKK